MTDRQPRWHATSLQHSARRAPLPGRHEGAPPGAEEPGPPDPGPHRLARRPDGRRTAELGWSRAATTSRSRRPWLSAGFTFAAHAAASAERRRLTPAPVSSALRAPGGEGRASHGAPGAALGAPCLSRPSPGRTPRMVGPMTSSVDARPGSEPQPQVRGVRPGSGGSEGPLQTGKRP